MGLWIGVALLVVGAWWLFRPRRRAAPAPEDDVTTPIDHAELEQAEQELRQDPGARSLGDEVDEGEDWGPGAR